GSQDRPGLQKLLALSSSICRPSLLVLRAFLVPLLMKIALAFIAASTNTALSVGWLERYSAAVPPTCGAAMRVPALVVVPPPNSVESILTPGAQTSTHAP